MTKDEKLKAEEVQEQVAQLNGWTLEDGKILTKSFKFPDFKEALSFTNQVGALAESYQHHPDIHLSWGRVVIRQENHEAGALTSLDFDVAKAIDDLYK